jgi:alcohol dehydrogenase
VLSAPDDREAWGAMQIGALLAGAAIERSMLGAAHSLANPLTAVYGTTHGVAVSLMLPIVVRFNGAVVAPLYGELLESEPPGDGPPGEGRSGDGRSGAEPFGEDDERAETLARRLESVRSAAGLPDTLREAGVPVSDRDRLGELAAEAARQWTLRYNPRQASVEDLRGLYERTF